MARGEKRASIYKELKDTYVSKCIKRRKMQHTDARPGTYRHGDAHIPQAKTNSSNKIKAAYAYREATIKQKSAKKRRDHNLRALKKLKKCIGC